MKIDPNNITNYNRNPTELQKFWLFSLIVAGKNADWAATKTEQLIEGRLYDQTPFDYLTTQGSVWLQHKLRLIKSGQYNRLEKAITESLTLDLYTCALNRLLTIYGVGPKTARFFLVHSRKDTKHAVLDTHILRWMGEQGVTVPKVTPGRLNYLRLEQVCLQLFEKHYPKLTVAEADLKVWKIQRRKYQSINLQS